MRAHGEKWLLARAPQWRGEQCTVRTDQCRAWLYLHGYIGDPANERLKRLIEEERATARLERTTGGRTRKRA